jgi:hypothetical protein
MSKQVRKGSSVGEQDAVQETDPSAPAPSAVDDPAPRRPTEELPADPYDPDVDSRAETLALTGIVTLAVGWFGVSWLMMKSPIVDAVGEAAGGVVTVLVVVSVFGAFRRSRRR